MRKFYIIFGLALLVGTFSMCNKAGVFPDDGYDSRLSGGSATTFDETSHALSSAIDGLSERDARVHDLGDATFSQTFVVDSRPNFTGLGPVFNNVSCISCHRHDGEGIPTMGFSNSGMLFRISIPGSDAHGGPLTPDGFGGQLQDQHIFGAAPEVTFNPIVYDNVTVTYPDGNTTTLKKPTYSIASSYIPMPAGYMLSPRLAPPVVGMGLLELVPEQTILSFQDPNDANNDGIRGKANYVYDAYTHQTLIGRFGWKANTATLLTQVATAYQQDMGITSYVQPVESAFGQTQMNAVPKELPMEIVDSLLNYTVFYVKTLAVPARRNVTDDDIKRGEYLFNQVNCSGCHRPTMQTEINQSLAQLSNQRIHPYTDLLVHDMGPGLADNRPDFLAGGQDWRTAPLWGVGLLDKANGIPYFLHDGRATTIEEAILWHDGEAKQSRDQFMQLNKDDRNRIIKFVESL
ncbi:di-heme oxidoreductase family protein [Ferruginibacter albus]|uniref:di-heme oxidoreductase family protein n=1 Tax=Ferruginibacter albus TaxID=2875540 RepID=UPI001CC72BCB|nr:di-heme oxidoredictase family protein [Ferruginibacter albus]UAY51552.1 hypothetical protein K9M53_13265 [Ferruginibacter albus]